MSTLERQTQIVQDLIVRAPYLELQIESVQQVGDETPDSHNFTLSCSCHDFVHLGFDEGQEGMWVMTALNTIRSHSEQKHPDVKL